MLNLFRSLSGKDMPKGKDVTKAVLDTLVSFLSEDCSPGSESLILLQKDDEASGLTTLEARIQFTVGALRMHPGDVSVQSAGCKCLSNFAITTEVVAQLVQAEALPLVCEALKRFWFEADLQRAACSALWNIARNNEARTLLGVNAAEAIFRTLELHKGSDFVQEAALGSLANLSPCADVQNYLCGKDKLHAIFLSMYTHRECDLLQTAACGLLNNLAHGDTHALTIGQMGGIRLIVNAMRTHCHNGKLLRNACAALANLSTEQKNFKKLLRAKALESLFYSYHCFEEDVPSLKEMARAALTNMGVRDLAFKTSSMHLAALNARGSLDAIVPMMEGKHTALYGDRRSFTFEENEDINCVDSELNTPLHLAIERRDAALTRTLVAQGADLHMNNKYDQSPIDLADVLCAEDVKREQEGIDGKYENGQDTEESASGEQVKEGIVEGRRRYKITKSIFRDMVCQFLSDVPSDVAGLLSEFVDISNFLKHVEVDTAFDEAEATWRNFRKFLKHESYTLYTPRCSDVSITSNGGALINGLGLPLQLSAVAAAGLGATSTPRGSMDTGALPLGALGGPEFAEAVAAVSASSNPGFRANQPPSLIIPGPENGGVSHPPPEKTPAQSALTRLHCRRVSHSFPGMEGLYRAAFGDGVVPEDELESKDGGAQSSSAAGALTHISTPFATNGRPDDRRRLHGGKRHNGALSWSQLQGPGGVASLANGVRRDSDVTMLDSIDESAVDDDADDIFERFIARQESVSGGGAGSSSTISAFEQSRQPRLSSLEQAPATSGSGDASKSSGGGMPRKRWRRM